MPGLSHEVTEGEAGRTVRSIALKEMRLSHSLFSSLKFSGGLTLDGEQAYANMRLKPGQVLSAFWEDQGEAALEPAFVPIRIVYEDDAYFVIDKPAPLPTLCSAHQDGPTLETALYARLGCPKDYVFRPVNRLDKGTSGLMVAARNGHAQQLLQRQLHTAAFVREYRAVCRGHLPEKAGTINLPIGKVGEGPKREARPDGLPAVTHYQVEQEGNNLSLVRLRLETGRTHQIRVHLAAMGCPIVGDYLYGEAHPGLPGRFALHACAVRFTHPMNGKEVRLASELPPALSALLDEL